MKRALFFVSLAAAVATFTSLRAASVRNHRVWRGAVAGQCADRRRKSRWSAYTSADFS
jgi:hypothetical protein